MKRTLGCNIAFLAITCFFINTIGHSQDVLVTGNIKHNNVVLPGASVSIGTKTTITDQDGNFSLVVPAGIHKMIITHAGYKKIEQTVIVEVGSKKLFDFDLLTNDYLEEVTIGSRSRIQRSKLQTAVPVDAYSFGQIVETGQISLTQMLNFLAPSLTASREVLNEPVTLRGLDPQHVLILIDGVRYHPMAWLFSGGLKGQLGKGSVGNDLNSIPFPAIETIEVLRDGAAAQYGSDAIGGVINIKLKKNIGTSIHTQLGEFYKGDGEKIVAGIYHGIPLRNKRFSDEQDFINFSTYYRNQAATFRGGGYEELIYLNYPPNANGADSARTKRQDEELVQSKGFDRKAMVDNAGNTKSVSKGILINSVLPLNNQTKILLTSSVNSRKLNRGGFFRLPRDRNGINYILFPDGVQPRNKTNTVDALGKIGLRGKTKTNLNWDITTSYGINSVRSTSTNSYNVTQTHILGEKAQTSFYNGTDLFKQLITDVNLSKDILLNKNRLEIHFAWGAEWRLENYRTKPGEEASWKNYDTVNYPRFSEPGFENVLNKHRKVFGVYAELESEFRNRLLFNIAARYEHYSDFGGNIAGKLATRYQLSPNKFLRLSVNNGFRAPSLQQRYYTSLAYALNARREAVVRGTFPNDHAVVRGLNVPVLTAEKSSNISGGITSAISKNLSLTVDLYWIQIKDRIVNSGTFLRDSLPILNDILSHYPELQPIRQLSFFSNAINTKTKGVDFVLEGVWQKENKSLGLSLAANFNATRLYGHVKTSDKLSAVPGSSTTLFNSEDRVRIENGQPRGKIIFSASYKVGRTKVIIRNTRFGRTSMAPLGLPQETFDPRILTDASITFAVKDWAAITLGGNNLMNTYPSRLKNYANTFYGGWIYSPEASPFGFNGGYYFLNMSFGLAKIKTMTGYIK